MTSAAGSCDRAVIEHADTGPSHRRVANIALSASCNVIARFTRRQHPVVTLPTSAGRAAKTALRVAGLAGYLGVGPGKRESGFKMIELGLRCGSAQPRPNKHHEP